MYRHILRRHRRPFALAVSGAALYAAATAASALVIRWVVDNVIQPRFDGGRVSSGNVNLGVAAIVVVGLVKCVGIVVRRRLATVTSMNIAHELRGQVLEAIGKRPLEWVDMTSSGQLVAHAGVDVEAVQESFGPLPLATGVAALLVAAITGLLIIDPVLGGVAAALLPLLALTGVVYERFTSPAMHGLQAALGNVSDIAYESIDGAAIVKAFGAADFEVARFATAAGDLRMIRTSLVRYRGWFEATISGLPTLASLVLVVVGAARAQSGDVSVGDVSGVLYLFALMSWPLRVTGWLLNGLVHGVAGHDRVEALLAEDVGSVPPVPRPRDGYAIECAGLGFAYPGGERCLVDVSFRVPVGQRTALVGPTGSGKSTLLQLLAGLRAPTAGSVAVWSGRGLVAFQEATLLSDTIENNVTLGGSFSDARIGIAMGQAQAGFADELGSGLATLVGERGATLSGGQRQRIALARALVRQPQVLLLDDVTSALDPSTEAAVLAAIGRLDDLTTLMVTNRAAAIASCARVIFLDGGRIIATGTPDHLYATLPMYRELIDAASAEPS